MYKTEWTHQHTPLLNRQQEELLEREIARISEDLESASDLVFHTVFLTDDIQGASVMVDGRDGVDDTLFLTYYETTKWVTLDEMEDR